MDFIDDLRQILAAQNKSKLCRNHGISWKTLHRIMSADGNPRLKNLVKVVKALGYELKIVKRENNS